MRNTVSLIKRAKIQTIQLAFHCCKASITPLKKDCSLKKTQEGHIFPSFLSLKTKALADFVGKRTDFKNLMLDLKLNSLYVFYKKKNSFIFNNEHKDNQILYYFRTLKRPLIFIKIINQVFNKAVKKSRISTPWAIKSSQSIMSRLTEANNTRNTSVTFEMTKKKDFSMKNTLIPLPNKKLKKYITNIKNKQALVTLSNNSLKSSSPLASTIRGTIEIPKSVTYSLINNKNTRFFGGYLVRADWVLDRLFEQLTKKKMNPRAAMNQHINEIRVLIDQMGSECPVRGIRITLTGRLGSRKKAMAQQISKCVGKVPLSTLRQNIDYKQKVLPTRFGLVGIKIWICYGVNTTKAAKFT